jgi:stringent starvation protein B
MLSKRPYLVPAFYDWIVYQGHVPHLVVEAGLPGVMVPAAFVDDGYIQLNIGPSAVRDFHMDRAAISFEARFAGKPERIYVPMAAVRAIIDRDTGQGANFPDEPGETFPDAPEGEGAAPAGRPTLRAVDGGEPDDAGSAEEAEGDSPDDDPPDGPGGGPGSGPGGGSGGGKGPGGKGGPKLRVVK